MPFSPPNDNDNEYLENITFDELTVGRTASIVRELSESDIQLFATVSGDINPAHLDEDYAKSNMFQGIIGHGMWSGALISMVLGTIMPGPGTIYLDQLLKFKRPVRIGDKITVKVTVQSRKEDKKIVVFDCLCLNQKGEKVVEGQATVLAPTEKIRRLKTELPQIEIQDHDHYHAIMQSCRNLRPARTAIVYPVDAGVIESVAYAVKENLITPVLVGPRNRVMAAAAKAEVDITGWEFVDVETSAESAIKTAELATSGGVDAIMKGSIHTTEMLRIFVPRKMGLRTNRYMSHAYLMDVPGYHKPLVITDAMVNILPNLKTKADICQNAIDFWRVIASGDQKPKVAVLAAVELVNEKMQATLDAPALCKMVDRDQILNCVMDGPLSFDNAVNKQAAEERGINSSVAGDADILVVPGIESGNILAKQLTTIGHADAAGIILGAQVPIILMRRADNLRTRLASCAMAVMLAAAKQNKPKE